MRPTTVLVLRGLGAVAILVALGILAQISLLSKVVGAILVGVLAMAVAAVAVVGNVVVASYDTQSRETVESAANSRLNAINQLGSQNANQAVLASQLCATRVNCQGYLDDVPQGDGRRLRRAGPAEGRRRVARRPARR